MFVIEFIAEKIPLATSPGRPSHLLGSRRDALAYRGRGVPEAWKWARARPGSVAPRARRQGLGNAGPPIPASSSATGCLSFGGRRGALPQRLAATHPCCRFIVVVLVLIATF